MATIKLKHYRNFSEPGFSTATASASEQLYELIYGHAGVGDDTAESARSDLLVVRYDNPSTRLVSAKNHVVAILAAEHEACPFQGGPHFSAGQVDRKLGHELFPCDYAAATSTNSLPASIGTGLPRDYLLR